MQCPLCRERQARRRCPAKNQEICAVCCGTKRTVEIACPPDCGYLASAQSHPPAAVRRRQERDLAFIMAMREGLTEAQADLLWGLLGLIGAHQADPLVRLTDEDLAGAAGAMAATFETSARGVIYEHRPDSLAAQRLTTDFKAFFAEVSEKLQGVSVSKMERDAVAVLRHVEASTRGARKLLDEGPDTGLQMVGRVVRAINASGGHDHHHHHPESVVADAPTSLLIKP
jgi:hypothetical protein